MDENRSVGNEAFIRDILSMNRPNNQKVHPSDDAESGSVGSAGSAGSATSNQEVSNVLSLNVPQLDNIIMNSRTSSMSRSMSQTPMNHFRVDWHRLKFQPPPTFHRKWIKGERDGKVIFKDLNGHFESGKLTAIMGTSGAGKSCLLNCIWGILKRGVTGSLEIQSNNVHEIHIAMIPQMDKLNGWFTAYETIYYASRLKNYDQSFDHGGQTNRVIKKLGLERCRDTFVRKCSGGEQKRISIATELVSNPSILLLDEPTSGLDSSATKHTVDVLKSIAHRSSVAIVATIHQPNAKVFMAFDHVYVLSPYSGCVFEGHPMEIIPLVERETTVVCHQFYNPSDLIVDIAANEHGPEAIKKLALAHQMSYTSDIRYDDYIDMKFVHPLENVTFKQLSFWRQFSILLSRTWTTILRDYNVNVLRLLISVIIPLFLGLAYGPDVGNYAGCPLPPVNPLQLSLSDLEMLQEKQKELTYEINKQYENFTMLFMVTLMVGFGCLMITVLIIPLEIAILRKEVNNEWYTLPAYFAARNVADIPITITTGIFQMYLSFALTGNIRDVQHLLNIAIVICPFCLFTQALGLCIGVIFSDSVVASTFIAPLSLMPFTMLSGFFIRGDSFPYYFMRKACEYSFFKHCFDCILIDIYGRGRCQCDQLAANTTAVGLYTENPQWLDFLVLFHSVGRNVSDTDGIGSRAIETVVKTLILGNNIKDEKVGPDSDRCSEYRAHPLETYNVHESDWEDGVIFMFVQTIIVRVAAFFVLYRKI